MKWWDYDEDDDTTQNPPCKQSLFFGANVTWYDNW